MIDRISEIAALQPVLIKRFRRW